MNQTVNAIDSVFDDRDQNLQISFKKNPSSIMRSSTLYTPFQGIAASQSVLSNCKLPQWNPWSPVTCLVRWVLRSWRETPCLMYSFCQASNSSSIQNIPDLRTRIWCTVQQPPPLDPVISRLDLKCHIEWDFQSFDYRLETWGWNL